MSQAQVARAAGIGKSQLSKYESGKELPKLPTLERILEVLGVEQLEFFYTLDLVDRRAADLGNAPALLQPPRNPPFPSLAPGSLLVAPTDDAFGRLFGDLTHLYHKVHEWVVLGRWPLRVPAKEEHAAASPPASSRPVS